MTQLRASSFRRHWAFFQWTGRHSSFTYRRTTYRTTFYVKSAAKVHPGCIDPRNLPVSADLDGYARQWFPGLEASLFRNVWRGSVAARHPIDATWRVAKSIWFVE